MTWDFVFLDAVERRSHQRYSSHNERYIESVREHLWSKYIENHQKKVYREGRYTIEIIEPVLALIHFAARVGSLLRKKKKSFISILSLVQVSLLSLETKSIGWLIEKYFNGAINNGNVGN